MKKIDKVGGIILRGKKLLVVRKRTKDNREEYIIPGGKREGNETDFETLKRELFNQSFNRFLIISLDVLICRYSPLFRAFPALFISEEPHKSFYYPSCFRSQK